MKEPIPLPQWQAALSVVDCGGFAQAAESLGKSQSSVSYAVRRLEDQLGMRIFRQQGRRAVPTANGLILLQRARHLLAQADALESAARELAQGRESVLRLAIDGLFPGWLLLQVLTQFDQLQLTTRIEVLESVLSGTDEALMRREADLVITPRVPQGFTGEPLMQVRFVAVAAPEHPLHTLQRPIDWADLRRHRQLVVRDSGSRRDDAGWLDAEQRWTFSHPDRSVQAACAGLGFAWYPELLIREPLAQGRLIPLPLAEGRHRHAMLYRVLARPDTLGPSCRQLVELLHTQVAQQGLSGLPAP